MRTPTKIASRAELDTLPPGLYELPDRRLGTAYDGCLDAYFEGELKEVAGIFAADHRLPRGFDVKVRPDGCSIATQWVSA